jgi:hypothetical protein
LKGVTAAVILRTRITGGHMFYSRLQSQAALKSDVMKSFASH